MTTITGRAGRYEPDADWRMKLFQHTFVAILRLWCWREFSLPVLAVLVVDQSGHPTLAFTAALVLGCTFVLLHFTNRDMVVDAFHRCRRQSRQLSQQLAWPRVARELGWARRIDDGWLVPDLLSWSEDERRVTAQVRPLPEQSSGQWDHMADALRRLVGGATAQWRESQGTLTIAVSRVELPAMLEWSPAGADLRQLVIGQRHGGTPLVLDALRTPHLLLAGATGSGKGGTIRTALASALDSGWQAVVIDPKESGEYTWLERLNVPVASTLAEQLELLRQLDAVRRRRQAVVKAAGADNWYQLHEYFRRGWWPLLVVIDEAADLLVPAKGRSGPRREHATQQHEAAELILQLTRKGRSAGIHVVLAIQRPDTAQLGDQGGALRNNLTARLALGSLDAEGIRMLGIPTSDPVATTLDGTPGRGVCVGFGDDPRPSACHVAWLDQRRALELVDPIVPQGLDAIESAGGEAISSAPGSEAA